MSDQLKLFEQPADSPSRRAKLKTFKETHGILTHCSRILRKGEKPWTALIPVDDDKGKDLLTIMSESCRLYEESKLIGFGESEAAAIRELCEHRGMECGV